MDTSSDELQTFSDLEDSEREDIETDKGVNDNKMTNNTITLSSNLLFDCYYVNIVSKYFFILHFIAIVQEYYFILLYTFSINNM